VRIWSLPINIAINVRPQHMLRWSVRMQRNVRAGAEFRDSRSLRAGVTPGRDQAGDSLRNWRWKAFSHGLRRRDDVR